MIAARRAVRDVPAARVAATIAARLEAIAAGGPAGRGCGSVHSVFPRAANVRLEDGRLLALHGPGALRSPFALALGRWPLPRPIAAGMAVDIGPGVLAVGSCSIHWGLAPRVLLRVAGPPLLADPWRRLLLEGPEAPVAPALLGPRGAAATRRLAQSIARGAPAAFAEAAETLAGLGEGLTPAGDDCVVGALAALHRARHPLIEDSGIAAALRRTAWTRTTDVGREFLLHAVEGAFAESVLDVVSGERGRFARGIAALLAHGASSGADTLYGLRLAARALGG